MLLRTHLVTDSHREKQQGGFLVYELADLALLNAPLCLHCAMPRFAVAAAAVSQAVFCARIARVLSPVARSYDVRRFRALRASWTGFEARFD